MKAKINIGWLVSGIIVILGVFFGLRYHLPDLTGMYTNTIFWFLITIFWGAIYYLCFALIRENFAGFIIKFISIIFIEIFTGIAIADLTKDLLLGIPFNGDLAFFTLITCTLWSLGTPVHFLWNARRNLKNYASDCACSHS